MCPTCPERPGIYAFSRTDQETGLRFCYIGQASKSILARCAQQLQEYDHIALSLKKRGFYNATDNAGGWMLTYWDCPVGGLNEAEQTVIKTWADNGYQLFNRTGGSQGNGKVVFDNKRQSKTYREGLAQGSTNARREVAHWFSMHLNVSMKKPTKNAEKALAKFEDFINLEAEENA